MRRTPPSLALLALLGCLTLPGCGRPTGADPLERIRERGVLRVATEAEFKPFEYVAPSGEVVGFDVDLARALADDLGVKLEVQNVRFESIINELTSGHADLILSGMTVTPERERSVTFSEPYFFTVTCLLVAKAREGEVRSVADLDDARRRVAVKEGTTGESAARERCPKAQIVSHKTENAAALDVAQGRADAFLYDLASVREHHRQHPDTTFLIEAPVTYEPYAVACPKDALSLKAEVDRVLRAMRADGRLAALMAKHGPDGSLERR